ncbi:hypothetical protein [Prauserella alba]|uniref:Uncharacterized protein n=1 Tax=Prauserella alba TaxID=176898 RepID=A0ABP4G4Y1_9PSEU|nr:hypothetical protein [Prauserella alba]MCP2182120.1 hypothetical protein [Prauserella alba]
MPEALPQAWPVRAVYRSRIAASACQALRRDAGHLRLVRATEDARTAQSRRPRYYLLDMRWRTDSIEIPLPESASHERWLTLQVEWGVADSYLLLATGPENGIDLLDRHVRRAVREIGHAQHTDVLAIRRHVEKAMAGQSHDTATGLNWTVTSVRASTRPTSSTDWRQRLDQDLHDELDTGY